MNNKGKKVSFLIQKRCINQKENSIDSYLKLFDSIVKPIV